ncbi:M20 family metallo-hydrolase [bacterium]|nr:M20 family metallo-hydrolase [bacterium]
MNKELFERISKRIDGYKNEMVELQKKLIPIQAIGPDSGGKGELEKASFLEPILRDLYDEVQVIKAPDERLSCGYHPSLVATIGAKSDEPKMWLTAHMDVVPAGDEKAWDTPPFEAVVKDGKIYGRGSEDNNQGLVSGLYALKALREEGVEIKNIGGLFVSDEESANIYGVEYVLENHKELFSQKDMICILDWGTHDGSQIEIAEKAIVWFKVKIKGAQCHAAWPDKGINAHRAGAHLICDLEKFCKENYGEKDELFDHPYSTIEPTKKYSNVPNINTIPGEDVICFDCRLLPQVDVDVFIKDVEGVFKDVEKKHNVKIDYTLEYRIDALNPTPITSPLVSCVSSAIESVYNVTPRPVGIGGGTVGGPFRREGLHVVAYGRLDHTLHGPNEYCVIDYMVGDAKVWAYAILDFLDAK